jgi:hypothetical protein
MALSKVMVYIAALKNQWRMDRRKKVSPRSIIFKKLAKLH